MIYRFVFESFSDLVSRSELLVECKQILFLEQKKPSIIKSASAHVCFLEKSLLVVAVSGRAARLMCAQFSLSKLDFALRPSAARSDAAEGPPCGPIARLENTRAASISLSAPTSPLPDLLFVAAHVLP